MSDSFIMEVNGEQRRYRVSAMRVADTRREALALADDDALWLVTCWPFDALQAGGPQRYVVSAEPVEAGAGA